MKAGILLIGLIQFSLASAGAIEATPSPTRTLSLETPESFSNENQTSQHLFKRYRNVIVNPDYQKKIDSEDGLLQTENNKGPQNWVRTISSTLVEIVHPTVIAGVTFGAKPPATTNGLEPWISLNKDGSPKTIKPQNKNGQIKNGKPDYGTYFQTATTITYNKEQLKAHNMDENEIYHDVQFMPEDDTYLSFNPLIRCTPDSYYNKGLAKNVLSAPFCTPRENQVLKRDKTYFVTWFSKFFEPQVEKVRIHLAYVKEAAHLKGYNKRSNTQISQVSFFTSEWITNEEGYYPLTIKDEWMKKEFTQKVLISIQADNIPDDEFNLLGNSTIIEIAKGTKVVRENYVDLETIDDGPNEDMYYIIMSIPTCVIIAAFGMYVFVRINKFDLSHLKKRTFQRDKTTHRRIKLNLGRNKKYAKLPQYSTELDDNMKTA